MNRQTCRIEAPSRAEGASASRIRCAVGNSRWGRRRGPGRSRTALPPLRCATRPPPPFLSPPGPGSRGLGRQAERGLTGSFQSFGGLGALPQSAAFEPAVYARPGGLAHRASGFEPALRRRHRQRPTLRRLCRAGAARGSFLQLTALDLPPVPGLKTLSWPHPGLRPLIPVQRITPRVPRRAVLRIPALAHRLESRAESPLGWASAVVDKAAGDAIAGGASRRLPSPGDGRSGIVPQKSWSTGVSLIAPPTGCRPTNACESTSALSPFLPALP